MKYYVEFDKNSMRFKYPARVYDKKPEGVPTVLIEVKNGEIFDIGNYKIEKLKNNQYKAVKKEVK